MLFLRKLYLWTCRRWGPRGMTLSAWAWVHAQETGDAWLRNRIDGAWLFFFGVHNHTQSAYQRETRRAAVRINSEQ
jgi:hypothetical protein